MITNELQAAIERNIEAVAGLIAEAWMTLDLLKGLTAVARSEAAADRHHACCVDAFYRVSFSSFYSQLGTVIDDMDGSLSLPRLFHRLRAAWHNDQLQLAIVAEVEAELVGSAIFRKIKAWRNKVISHHTPKVRDKEFYEANKVGLEEIERALADLQAMFNKLSCEATGTMYSLESPIPGLSERVQKLFGVEAKDT